MEPAVGVEIAANCTKCSAMARSLGLPGTPGITTAGDCARLQHSCEQSAARLCAIGQSASILAIPMGQEAPNIVLLNVHAAAASEGPPARRAVSTIANNWN